MNKKAIYFTLITVLIVSLLLLAISIQNYISPKADIPTIKARVQIGDDFVKNLDSFYIERALYVSSYWALESLSLYENRTNAFFSSRADFSDKFSEVMVSGTIGGVSIDSLNKVKLMENNTFLHRLSQIENASLSAYNIKTNFSRNLSQFNIIIMQTNDTGPWKISVNATTIATIDADLATWNQIINTQTVFAISGLHDPLYFVKTNGAFQKRINKTAIQAWNVTNFYNHIYYGTYSEDSRGISFIDRFYNNVSPSECCGIESPINPNAMGIPDTPSSYIDYCFYSLRCPPQNTTGTIWNITGITTSNPLQNFYEYKLDDYHVAKYNVTAQAHH